MFKSKLDNLALNKKRVFLRADLNVPLVKGKIIQEYKLNSILPTIDKILKKGGKVILATHIGRPKNKEECFSTKQLIPWFNKKGYKIEFEKDLEKAIEKSKHNSDTILLLENLRFYPGEKNKDQDFAKKLAMLADYYINDAFGTLHRDETSITLLPLLYPKAKRTIGPLIESEVLNLNKILQNTEKTFLLIIGGAKVKDKLPLIKEFINKVDTIILCPAIVFTFLKALGKEVGKSLVNETLLESAKNILDKAKANNVKILFPVDYQIAIDKIDGPLKIVKAENFPKNGIGISIGPKSILKFKKDILNAKTILFNGAIGFWERTETLQGMENILQLIAESKAFSTILGGDSTAAAKLFLKDKNIDFLSTGGGASLDYLAKGKLPGLIIFEQPCN